MDYNEYIIFQKNGSGTITVNNPHKAFAINRPDKCQIGIIARSSGWGTRMDINCYVIALLEQDDISKLFELTNIQGTTISDLLAESSTLLDNEKAVSYMLSACTGDFMGLALSNSTFMTALASSKYRNKIITDPSWGKFYAYFND